MLIYIPVSIHLVYIVFDSVLKDLYKQEFIHLLQLFSDILCVQEHFVLNSRSRKYNNIEKLILCCGDNFNMFITPAVKDNNVMTRGKGSLTL